MSSLGQKKIQLKRCQLLRVRSLEPFQTAKPNLFTAAPPRGNPKCKQNHKQSQLEEKSHQQQEQYHFSVH